MTAPKVPEALVTRLRSGDRFLVTSHVSPDGDAIGSCLGLARLLRRLGKGATVWLHDPPPAVYRALPGSDRVHSGDTPPPGFPEHHGAAVVLECPSLDRCGLEPHLEGLELINVDHHLGNQQYGAVNWVDTAAPAVGELIYHLGREMHVDIDADTADCLYLTLVTDTGGFRFSNTTARTFDAAAALVREGASPDRVSHWLYESQPESALRLLGEILGSLELHHDGRVATVRLSRDMVERAGARPGDSEGLIDYPRSIAGVEAVAMFRQLDDGRTKVSLRSRGTVDVERVARRNGGGGHHNAAGFTGEGEAESLERRTVEALIEALDRAAEDPERRENRRESD